jgi:hypothetical protein
MITWIETKASLVTSLILWDQHYEPYQVIIFRHTTKQEEQVIYYFQLDDVILAYQQVLSSFRTETEEERQFQIARAALLILEKSMINKEQGEEATPTKKDLELEKLLKEAFLSSYAIALMREKSPDYGFYSLSPNFKKLEKMLQGLPYQLIHLINKILMK